MNTKDIQPGETYLFMATDAPARKSLEGKPFTVVEIKSVWRRNSKRSARVKRFFNEEGVGARADELEPLPERESPCTECATGEMILQSTNPGGSMLYECNSCHAEARFP